MKFVELLGSDFSSEIITAYNLNLSEIYLVCQDGTVYLSDSIYTFGSLPLFTLSIFEFDFNNFELVRKGGFEITHLKFERFGLDGESSILWDKVQRRDKKIEAKLFKFFLENVFSTKVFQTTFEITRETAVKILAHYMKIGVLVKKRDVFQINVKQNDVIKKAIKYDDIEEAKKINK